jgi:hypothetical protein
LRKDASVLIIVVIEERLSVIETMTPKLARSLLEAFSICLIAEITVSSCRP